MFCLEKICGVLIVVNLFLYGNCEKFGPEYDLSQNEFLRKYGYYYESYDIVTEDNYILNVIRIPRGKTDKWKNDANPILISHGLGSTSMTWLINGPEKGLAFRLADEGYDVWLANTRGNKYSRKHKYLNPDDKSNSYWNFSFEESGRFDLPAMIDFMLQKTQKYQIIYIAVSQGATNLLVMGSMRPEYNDRIQLAITMAPVSFLTNPPGFFVNLLKYNEHIINFVGGYILNIKELPFPQPLINFFKFACKDGSLFQNICFSVFTNALQSDPHQLNRTKLATIAANLSGVSLKIITHYLQTMRTECFKQFDYGHAFNMQLYGQSTPPEYNLKLVTFPIKIIHAMNDILLNIYDINKLLDVLPNIIEVKIVKDELFGHADFNFAIDINSLVYDDIVYTVKKYTNHENEV